jgi:transcriptional regulator with XRE-family HTH domain
MAGQKRDTKFDDRLPDIGKRLLAIREQAGLSQDDMARCLGFSRRQWTSWEYGQVTPSLWVLLELMDKLQVEPAWVIDGPGLIPVLRSTDGGAARVGRLRKDVQRMVRNLGLEIPDGFVHQLAMIIFNNPVEKDGKRQVHEMLRQLAIGKDG